MTQENITAPDDNGTGVVWHKGKALRKGYTTGSCATAAAKVAALMVLRQEVIQQVSIVTPSGVTLNLNVEDPLICGQSATAAIRKDGGDDIDATHGMLIFARVAVNDSGIITLDGGEGVGRVTKVGVGLPIGDAAINKPRARLLKRRSAKSSVRTGGQISPSLPRKGKSGRRKPITAASVFSAEFLSSVPAVLSRRCRKRAGNAPCPSSWK